MKIKITNAHNLRVFYQISNRQKFRVKFYLSYMFDKKNLINVFYINEIKYLSNVYRNQ